MFNILKQKNVFDNKKLLSFEFIIDTRAIDCCTCMCLFVSAITIIFVNVIFYWILVHDLRTTNTHLYFLAIFVAKDAKHIFLLWAILANVGHLYTIIKTK